MFVDVLRSCLGSRKRDYFELAFPNVWKAFDDVDEVTGEPDKCGTSGNRTYGDKLFGAVTGRFACCAKLSATGRRATDVHID